MQVILLSGMAIGGWNRLIGKMFSILEALCSHLHPHGRLPVGEAYRPSARLHLVRRDEERRATGGSVKPGLAGSVDRPKAATRQPLCVRQRGGETIPEPGGQLDNYLTIDASETKKGSAVAG